MSNDPLLVQLFIYVVVLLSVATTVVLVIRQKARAAENESVTVQNLVARTKAWWLIVAVMFASVLIGQKGLFVFYGLLSMLALREYISVMNTRVADHRTLLWIFLLVIPVQYMLAAINWYVMFLIFIPVYCGVLIPARMALSGDPANFLVRSSTVQWGVLLCVYFLSHLPMLLHVHFPGLPSGSPRLLFYLVVVSQLSDVFQYTFGKLFGKTKVSPTISPNKTVEGLILGSLAAVSVGAGLWWITPFPWYGAAILSLVIVAAGFLGGLVMSAIKRDLGVKDWGTMIAGHGGVLDRIDSLVFSAPVYFHLVVFYTDAKVEGGPSVLLESILRLQLW